jgi:hypothetical protein
MAKIFVNARYESHKEVCLGDVKPGHTILIENGSGEVQPYIICKLGNTPIRVTDSKKNIVVMNPVTGRIILKHPAQKCVVVSGLLEINPYTTYKTTGNNYDQY